MQEKYQRLVISGYLPILMYVLTLDLSSLRPCVGTLRDYFASMLQGHKKRIKLYKKTTNI